MDPQRKSCPILSRRVFLAFRPRSTGLLGQAIGERAAHRTAFLSRSAVAQRPIGHRAQGCSCWPDQTTEGGRRSSRFVRLWTPAGAPQGTGRRGTRLSAAASLRGGTRRETFRGRRPVAQPAFEPKPRAAVVRQADRWWLGLATAEAEWFRFLPIALGLSRTVDRITAAATSQAQGIGAHQLEGDATGRTGFGRCVEARSKYQPGPIPGGLVLQHPPEL